MDGSAAPPPDRWRGQDPAYRRARRLEDAGGRDARAFCEALLDDRFPGWREDAAALAEILAGPQAAPGGLSLAALNAYGLLALAAHAWETARALASEVTARDHHDLLAQRIFDAAAARSDTLDTPLEAWLSERTCPAPFAEMETRENGDIHFCCSAWQPVPIGRIGDGGDQWRSDRAEEIRRSVTDGDFAHCSRWHCPRIAERRLPRRDRTADVPAGPKRVILSHDRSCNLACPSCRTCIIMADRARSEQLDALYDATLRPLVSGAEVVKVTGSGDPFGSRHFRRVIAELAAERRGRRIQLQTNGVLADNQAWEELGLWNSVASVWVSIDATRPDTYAALRGGDFARLMDNLEFLGILRRAGELPSLRLDMVVQRDNFDEVGELVDLAARIGADGVYLLRLRNWGTFTAAEFRARDVCHPDHPEHGRLRARLADPRLHTPGVELGSLAPLARRGPAP